MSGGGGGGGNTTTVQKADPWKGVQPYLYGAYSDLSKLYQQGSGPKYYPGSTIATPNALEGAGQNFNLGQYGNLFNVGQQGLFNNAQQGQLSGSGATQGQQYANAGATGMLNLAGVTAQGAPGATTAMNNLLGYGSSGVTSRGTNNALDAMNQLNAAGDPANNPYFKSAVNSAIRPVTEQFREQVLPGIKNGAMEAGQLGGSRQGIAEGLASRSYMNTVGDITSNMGNAAYAQGLNALQASGQLGQSLAGMGLSASQQAGALGSGLAGLTGQLQSNVGNLGSNIYGQGLTGLGQTQALQQAVQQGLLTPGQMLEQIGQQRTADRQQIIDADMARYNYNQNLPYTMINDYLQLLQGQSGGTTTASQSGGGGSRTMGALGGAASGAALGSMFGPMGMGIGAAGGALYGLFA